MPGDSPQTCNADFTAALIRRNLDSALAFLTDDVVFFYSNGSVLSGKAAFASLMTASWKMVAEYSYSAIDPKWIVSSDEVASLVYGFEWSGVAREEKVGGIGRGTRIFRKLPDGWLVAHEHLSAGKWLP